jgi:ankyrin repeat protein
VQSAARNLVEAKRISRELGDSAIMTAMREQQPASRVDKAVRAELAKNPNVIHVINKERDNALLMAMRDLKNYENLVPSLINAKIALDHQDRYSVTALMLAAGEAKVESLMLLLDAGAPLETVGRDGATALFLRC